jgi:hypothetical protein
MRAAGRKTVRACIEAFLEQHDKDAPTATVPPGTRVATATALTMPSVPDSRAINLLFRPLTTRETAFVADGSLTHRTRKPSSLKSGARLKATANVSEFTSFFLFQRNTDKQRKARNEDVLRN